MKAVYKRELKAYFTSIIGWIFLAAFFFVFDLYFVANNLIYGSAQLSSSLGNIVFIFIIIIPILAMRSMSDDRRTKTDQLLYTSPVSIPKIIIGKYLALLTIYSIAMGVVALSPLFLSIFGTVPMGKNYALVMGVWLYGCLALAICVFISSITESQVIAAVLSFALLFVGYMLDSIAGLISSSDNLFTQLMSKLSMMTPLNNFSGGVIDIPGIVYYVSGTVLFLFLTCQVVQKYRWSVSARKLKRGVFNSAFVVIGIAIAVAANVFVEELPEAAQSIDVTSNHLYSLTDETYQVLEVLDEDITMYVLANKSDVDDIVAKTLKDYESGSSHITVEYVDPAVSPNFYSTYTDTAPSSGSIIVVCGERSKVVDYSNLYETSVNYSTYSYETTGYDGEGQLTSAIGYVITEDMPVVYVIDGHGETTLDSSVTEALEKMNVSVETITLLTEDAVPEDAEAIIINGPTSDFSADDAQKVIDYLAGGGRALITTTYEATDELTNFNSILAKYDISVASGLLMESDTSHYYQYPYYLLPTVESADQTSSVDNYVFAPFMQALTNLETDTENLTWTDLLTTSSTAYVKSDLSNLTTYEWEDGDAAGQFSVAAQVTDSSTGAQVTVVTSTYLFTANADEMVSGQNMNLFKGIAGTLVDSDSSAATTSIAVKSYSSETLTVSQAVSVVCEIVFIILVPIVLILLGITIWMRRRRA